MGDQINRPLLRMADAFDDLAGRMISQTQDVDLYLFATVCSTISPIFLILGVAFSYMQKEYSDKVDHLIKASKTVPSIHAMIDQEIESKTVRHGGNTRSLLRVIRGLDVTRLFCENLLTQTNISSTNAAIDAYEKVFSEHHAELLRSLVKEAMKTMPSRSRITSRLNEDDASTRVLYQRIVTSTHVIILYVQKTFHSRNLGIDWYVDWMIDIIT